MLTENEILDAHAQALKEARDICLKLARNADPELIAPRGALYGQLRDALGRIEGSARQMCHWREDARWIKAGIFWAKTRRVCQVLFVGQRWADFQGIAKVCERGLVSRDELRDTRTGVRGPVLPKRPSSWLIMPDMGPVRAPAPRFLN